MQTEQQIDSPVMPKITPQADSGESKTNVEASGLELAGNQTSRRYCSRVFAYHDRSGRRECRREVRYAGA
jgi:hypothetical protein